MSPNIPLPGWMAGEVLEAWHDYVQQRARDKKAMTPRSMLGRIKRLQELKTAGHDPLQCLDEAINGHWLDFYAPKDKPIQRAESSQADQTQAYLADLERDRQQAAQDAADPVKAASIREMCDRAAGRLRRVA